MSSNQKRALLPETGSARTVHPMFELDRNTLLFLHNHVPHQASPRTKPLIEAFKRAAGPDGQVITASVSETELCIDNGVRVLVRGEEVRPGRLFARLFTATSNHNRTNAQHAAGQQVVNALWELGAVVANNPRATAVARSKLATAVALAAAGVPVPKQRMLTTPYTGDPAPDVLGWPQVLKRDTGMQGTHVVLTQDEVDQERELNRPVTHGDGEQPWLVQEFLRESAGVDLRALVLGGDVIAGLRRRATNGDFRANLALGGVAEPTPLSPAEKRIAQQAAQVVGLDVAGVDIVNTSKGPRVLEVNACPALSTIAQFYSDKVYDRVAEAVFTASR